ncbi:uncharacterized protein LOC124622103 [Schistocerca americana]|uniref:uncharacterized protein LOC124622103 n=1 Tax=Schistocerca americana TaxID=7009 RepID=UPI001F501871|nr:uncharacterized protein LOC124622103 [Schistocerca americana]
MAEYNIDISKLPEDVRDKLAELDLELSEGTFVAVGASTSLNDWYYPLAAPLCCHEKESKNTRSSAKTLNPLAGMRAISRFLCSPLGKSRMIQRFHLGIAPNAATIKL